MDTMTSSTNERPASDAPRRRRRRRRTIALLVGAPVLAAVLVFVGVRLFAPHIYSGTVYKAPDRAPAMEGLTYTDGTPVDLAALRGDVVVVFFGYTHCPDVCPTTLVTAAKAVERVDSDRVHLLMVSVDPERDTPERLAQYVASFNPEFRGVIGDAADVARVATTYGVFFARGEDTSDGGYTVDHTASLMGIDTDGRLRIVWSTAVTSADLAADIDALL
jgi:protein SCO1/2